MLTRGTAAAERRWRGSLDEWSAAIIGLAVVLSLIAGAGSGWKALVVVGGGLLGASALAVLSIMPGAVETVTLFGLAATLSISLKIHPVFRENHLGGAIGFRISVTEILLAMAVACAVRRLVRHRVTDVTIDRPILMAAAAYALWAAVSTAFSDDIMLGLFELSAVCAAFAVFVLMSSGRWSQVWRTAFVAGLLCGLVLQSAVAITQVLRPGMVALEFLGAEEDAGGDDAAQLEAADVGTTTVAGDTAYRPTGLLIHPNVLGAYFVLTLPIALAAWLGASAWLRSLATIALGLGAAALYLTLSRTGWIGTGAALMLFAIVGQRWRLFELSRAQRVTIVAAAIVVVAGLAWKADRIYLRLVETASDAIQFRRDLAVTAWNMTKDHPFAGVGLNTFIYHAEQYDPSGTSRLKLFPAHNVYLLELAETGFPGGIAFLILVIVTIVRPFRAARLPNERDNRLLGLAIACGLAAFWLTQLSDYVYRIPILTSLVWTHLGLALGLSKGTATE